MPRISPMPTLAYRNPSLTVEERVADLLGRMTLEEKVGQLMLWTRAARTSRHQHPPTRLHPPHSRGEDQPGDGPRRAEPPRHSAARR